MTGVVWKVTQYGVEADGFEIDTDRLAQIKKGRYAAIKQVCSRFYGDANDLKIHPTNDAGTALAHLQAVP